MAKANGAITGMSPSTTNHMSNFLISTLQAGASSSLTPSP
jgi:hypothetical protein